LHKAFKEAKQLLGLGKCQSNDFDAQIADTTITMIQHLLLTLKYRFELDATGEDLSYILVEATDNEGNVCPNAHNSIQFKVDGPATIAGVENGNPLSTESAVADHRKLFYGKAMLIIRTKHEETGVIKIEASSENLMPEKIELISK